MEPTLKPIAKHYNNFVGRRRRLGLSLAPLLLLAGTGALCTLPLYHDAFWRGAAFASLWPHQVLLVAELLAATGLLGLTRLTPHVTSRHVILWILLLLVLPVPSWALDAPVADVAWPATVLYFATLGLMVAYGQEDDRRRRIGNILAALSLAIPLTGFLLWTLTGAFSRPVPLAGDCHILSQARRDGCIRTVRSTTPVYFFIDAEGETKLIYGNGRRLWVETPDARGRWFNRTTFLLQRGGNGLTLIPTPRRDFLYVRQHIVGAHGPGSATNVYLIDLTEGKAVVRGALADEVSAAAANELGSEGRGSDRWSVRTPPDRSDILYPGSATAGAEILRASHWRIRNRPRTIALSRLTYDIRPARIYRSELLHPSPPWITDSEPIWSRTVREFPDCIAFTPDGRRLMTAAGNALSYFDTATGVVVPGPSAVPAFATDAGHDLCPLRFLSEETILLVNRTELLTWSLSTGRFTDRQTLPRFWFASAPRNPEIEIGPNRQYLAIGRVGKPEFRPEETRAIYRIRQP